MRKNLLKKEKKEVLAYLQKRFGFEKEVFRGLSFFKTQRKIYLITNECLQNELFPVSEVAGLAIVRPNGVLKPTTAFLQLFGHYAKKNIIILDSKDAENYIKGQDIDISDTKDIDSGYVIIKFKKILGCANLKDGVLKNMLPKSRRANIKL